jgi:hypothetical protein
MLREELNLRLFRGTYCVEMCFDPPLGICAADFPRVCGSGSYGLNFHWA